MSGSIKNEVLRAAVVCALVTAVLLTVVIALRIDVSAARDFRSDALVRDAFAPAPEPPKRFMDPSPFSIWLSYDWFVWDSLRGGHLPLWERLQGGGYSPLLSMQSGVFHPLRWLATLSPRETMPSVLIVLCLSLAALGWYFFGESLGLGSVASVAGALLFVSSAPLLSFAHFSGALVPLAHLPWIVLAYRRASTSRRAFAALAILLGLLFLGGHPLIELSVCLAVLSFAVVDAIAARGIRPLLVLAAAALCGLLFASVAILPPLLAIPESWSYKTAGAVGLSYQPLTFKWWYEAIGTALIDTHAEACCLDNGPFYRYVGAAAILLIVVVIAATAMRRERRFTALLVVVAVWFLIAFPGPWMAFLRRVPPLGYLKDWYYTGAFAFLYCAAAAAGVTILWRSGRAARISAAVLVLFALGSAAMRAREVFQPQRWQPIAGGAIVKGLRSESGPLRITGLWGQTHLPNSARLTHIEDVRLSGPVIPLRYLMWWRLVDPKVHRHSFMTTPMTYVLDSPLVDDFNIVYVLQDRRRPAGWFHSAPGGLLDTPISSRLHPPEFQLVDQTATAQLHANAGVLRRAHFAREVILARHFSEALQLLGGKGAVVRRASVLEAPAVPPGIPPQARGGVTVTYPSDAEVVLETESDTGGLVVLHDSFASGWRATVDGNEAEIYPVNVLSRGVVVPPGKHRIAMSYVPPGLVVGAALSAATLLALIALAFSSARAARA